MSLQEQLITELLDPRTSKSAREMAAAEEIKWLRSKVKGPKESWNDASPAPEKADKDSGMSEVKSG